MGILYKTVACLRVMGDDLIPNAITNQLGCEPTQKMIKGEPFSWHKQGKPRIAKSGMWRFDAVERVPGDLDSQVFEILNLLTSDLDVWECLSKKHRMDIFCGLFMDSSMEGISLSSETMVALGQRRIEIDFDIYGPDED